jgi:hypothetical protein
MKIMLHTQTRARIGTRFVSSASKFFRSPVQSPTFGDFANRNVLRYLTASTALHTIDNADSPEDAMRWALCVALFRYNEPSPL